MVGVQLVARPLLEVLLRVLDVYVVQAVFCAHLIGCQLQVAQTKNVQRASKANFIESYVVRGLVA